MGSVHVNAWNQNGAVMPFLNFVSNYQVSVDTVLGERNTVANAAIASAVRIAQITDISPISIPGFKSAAGTLKMSVRLVDEMAAKMTVSTSALTASQNRYLLSSIGIVPLFTNSRTNKI